MKTALQDLLRQALKKEGIESEVDGRATKRRIVVESVDQITDRWTKALKGKVKRSRGLEILSAVSTEILTRFLGKKK